MLIEILAAIGAYKLLAGSRDDSESSVHTLSPDTNYSLELRGPLEYTVQCSDPVDVLTTDAAGLRIFRKTGELSYYELGEDVHFFSGTVPHRRRLLIINWSKKRSVRFKLTLRDI